MSALNLPQNPPSGETLPQWKTAPQLSPRNCFVEHCQHAEREVPHWLTTWGHHRRVRTYIDKKAKDGPPAQAQDQVDWPVHKGGREWDEPYQGKEEGQRGHDLGVDETAERP